MKHSIRHTIGLGIAMPATIYTTVSLAVVSTYSENTYNRSVFNFLYDGGVYRYRIVGRQLVLLVAALLDRAGWHLNTSATLVAQAGSSWDLFDAFVVVNGVAFIGLSFMLFRFTVRDESWSTAYIILITLVGLSAYVVTPYDFLSYLFIVAAFIVAIAARPWSWPVCFVLAVLGTATRESFVIGVVALVGVVMARPGGIHHFRKAPQVNGGDPMLRAAISLILGSIATYVFLRVALANPGDQGIFWNQSLLQLNMNMSSAVAVFIMATGSFALLSALPARKVDADESGFDYQRATGYFWTLSIPYIAVTFITGAWFEALRLVLPLLLGQYLIRYAFEHRLKENAISTVDIPAGSKEELLPKTN